ncbi:MAG: hypothetical protein ACOX5G_03720 [Kiritimatiellia bacterium]
MSEPSGRQRCEWKLFKWTLLFSMSALFPAMMELSAPEPAMPPPQVLVVFSTMVQ